MLAVPMGSSVQAGEPGHVGSTGDSKQGGPSTSPTPAAWWGLGSHGLGFWGDPVHFSEPPEGGGPPQSEPPALGLRSLSPQPWVCGVHLPCASGHLEAAPWGDSQACSPPGEPLRHWVFFAVRILTACGYVRCTCVWVPVSMTECSMQKEAVFLIYRMSKMAGLALSWEDHAPVGQNDVTWLSVLNVTEG